MRLQCVVLVKEGGILGLYRVAGWLGGRLFVWLCCIQRIDGRLDASLPLFLLAMPACLPACFPVLCANLTAMQRHDRRPGGRAIGRHRHYVLTTFLCAVVVTGLIFFFFPLSHTWVE